METIYWKIYIFWEKREVKLKESCRPCTETKREKKCSDIFVSASNKKVLALIFTVNETES